MKFLYALFIVVIAFYVYFVGYASWFFFLAERDEWAKAITFFALAAILPLIFGVVWWRIRSGALSGLKSQSRLSDIETDFKVNDSGGDGDG